MKTNELVLLLQAAGILHLGLMWAGLTMPRVVGLGAHLATLPPFICRLVWVYYSFIALCLAAFGAVTFFFAETLASGAPLARAVCAFLCCFWLMRLVVATFVFDVRPYLRNGLLRLGYHATNVVFAFLPVVYGWAALKGGRL